MDRLIFCLVSEDLSGEALDSDADDSTSTSE
jgi:hypothetical protein